MKRFTHFLFYNNTVPLMFGVLFLGAGATFAASPEARDAVVDSSSEITAMDNSYLLNTDITDATVNILINSVTDNSDAYYIEYQMGTLEARDGAWQPVTRTKTLVVDKESVVGRDLGLYAEEELAEVHAAEIRLLKETQQSERRAGLTQKTVTTEYSGLVGQFFDASQEAFPQYDPLISPSVGVPLTSDQEAEHREIRRQIEEAQKKEEQASQPPEDSNGEDPDGTPPSGGGPINPLPNPDPEPQPDPTPDPIPTPEPDPTPVPDPEPQPDPTPDPLPSNDPEPDAVLDALLL